MPQTQYNLHLKGFVGGADFDRNYVDYVLAKNVGKDVNVLIDSLGGNLATALSIAAAFKNHGKVSVHFVGMNASAATIASLGAAHISIDKNAMYLVHKCSTAFFEWGSLNADQFRTLIADCEKAAADLDKLDVNIASMYAGKCKKKTQCLLDLMKVGGWLSAKDALEWGFVDEITDLDDEPAPVLTDAVASELAAAGIPLPNLPVEEKENPILSFFEKMAAIFQSKSKPQLTMNKNYKSICALLAIESIALTDGKASLTDEQLTALDKALEMKLQVITDLEAQIAALKAAPAATTTTIVDDTKQGYKPSEEKSDYELFCDTVNAAYINNSDNVFIVEDMKGNYRVLGNDKWSTKSTVAQDLGQGATGTTSTTISVEATDEVPAPFYKGTIETEDGEIDCSGE